MTAGNFFQDDSGNYGLGSGRRGSLRANAEDPASVFFGSLQTVGGPDGGDQVFGPNGENFVLSTEINPANLDAFGDIPDPDNSVFFSTIHVANLVDDNVELTAPVTSRNISGYAAGVMEGWDGGGSYPPVIIRNVDSDNFEMSFDAGSHTFGADMSVSDVTNRSERVDYLQLSFGDGADS